MPAEEEDAYKDLMESIGHYGFFQKRFLYLFNCVFVATVSMPFMNNLISLDVPDHWCHLPGRNGTNFTIEQWKNLTLPSETDNRDQLAYSKCRMYDLNSTSLDDAELQLEVINRSTIGCRYGWEYDTTWYSSTIPSSEDWVCEDDIYVADTLMWGRVGSIIGIAIFGHLADKVGRRPVLFASLAALTFGRLLSTGTAHIYPLFAFSCALADSAALAVYQTPIAIGMEMTDSERRATFAMLQSVGWSLGICTLPLVAWLARDWILFQVLTTLPCLVFFFLFRLVPESPHWLASQGRVDEAGKVLQEIAKANKRNLPSNYRATLEKVAQTNERTYGVASLFKTKRLALWTFIITLVWAVNGMSYNIAVLNIFNMGGNPFLNFFLSSLSELPGYISGRFFTDRFGRRWTQCVVFFFVTLAALAAVGVSTNPDLDATHVALAVFIRYGNSLTFYAIYLHGMEVYPTCLRQTGMAVGTVAAAILEGAGPYVVYLGTAYDIRYPYLVLGLINFLACFAILFLPETLHRSLPSTLAEADAIGKDQSFWSFPKKHSPTTSGSNQDQREMKDFSHE